jgi:hypothetical protein
MVWTFTLNYLRFRSLIRAGFSKCLVAVIPTTEDDAAAM